MMKIAMTSSDKTARTTHLDSYNLYGTGKDLFFVSGLGVKLRKPHGYVDVTENDNIAIKKGFSKRVTTFF